MQGIQHLAGRNNIADADAYGRDATVRAVLSAFGRTPRLVHIPIGVANAAAALATRLHPAPILTRYAVDQLAHGVVLNTARAATLGYTPNRALPAYLATVSTPR